jgi:hypothetical protein
MPDDIHGNRASHSRESGNSEKHLIPEPAPYLIRGQARNDQQEKIYIVGYNLRNYNSYAERKILKIEQ